MFTNRDVIKIRFILCKCFNKYLFILYGKFKVFKQNTIHR